jgi:hypothetical protein
VHRLIGTFTYAHLWSVPPDLPNHLILLGSVGKIRRHDGWKGSDIVQLHSTSYYHLLHHLEGKHFSVLSSPPSDRDISTCRAHMAHRLKNILCGCSEEWLDEDLHHSSLSDTSVTYAPAPPLSILTGPATCETLLLLVHPSGLDSALTGPKPPQLHYPNCDQDSTGSEPHHWGSCDIVPTSVPQSLGSIRQVHAQLHPLNRML